MEVKDLVKFAHGVRHIGEGIKMIANSIAPAPNANTAEPAAATPATAAAATTEKPKRTRRSKDQIAAEKAAKEAAAKPAEVTPPADDLSAFDTAAAPAPAVATPKTKAEVSGKFLELARSSAEGKNKAYELLSKYDAKTMGDIKEGDFDACYADVEASLAGL